MSQHTPTPWQVWKGHNVIFANVRLNTPESIGGEQIADCGDNDDENASANAEFIVRAVNSHEALLETLKHGIVNCKECRVTKSCERCELSRKAISEAEARP